MTFTTEEKQKIKAAFNERAQESNFLQRIFNQPKMLHKGGKTITKGNDIYLKSGKSYSAKQIAKGIDKGNKAGDAGLGFVEFYMTAGKGKSFDDVLKMVRF